MQRWNLEKVEIEMENGGVMVSGDGGESGQRYELDIHEI